MDRTPTPGPWHVEQAEVEIVFGHQSGALAICTPARQEIGRIRGVFGVEAAQANARLMAAAPELLAACVAATKWIAEDNESGTGRQLRFAIARATEPSPGLDPPQTG